MNLHPLTWTTIGTFLSILSVRELKTARPSVLESAEFSTAASSALAILITVGTIMEPSMYVCVIEEQIYLFRLDASRCRAWHTRVEGATRSSVARVHMITGHSHYSVIMQTANGVRAIREHVV